MSTLSLHAQTRQDIGKGASRRLRRLEHKVPAVVYGGDKAPQLLVLPHNVVLKALESESIYSSVFHLFLDDANTPEPVILKALQRHPYKPVVMHMDFQRVSAQDILIKSIPLHFINEADAPGVQEGGVINHIMTQVEVRCEASHLPEFIEVDLSQLELDQILHLTDLRLPEGVVLAQDPTKGDHDHPVVSIHLSRAEISEEATEETPDVEATTADEDESQASEPSA